MDIDPLNRVGKTSWIIAIVALVAVAAAQVYQIVVATSAAGSLDGPARKSMHRLAGLGVAVLSVVLVALFWLAVRLFRARRIGPPLSHPRTPYVDAWAAAGERFELDEDETSDDDEDDTVAD